MTTRVEDQAFFETFHEGKEGTLGLQPSNAKGWRVDERDIAGLARLATLEISIFAVHPIYLGDR